MGGIIPNGQKGGKEGSIKKEKEKKLRGGGRPYLFGAKGGVPLEKGEEKGKHPCPLQKRLFLIQIKKKRREGG